MKKIIILGSFLGLLLVAGLVYYFFFTGNDYGEPRPPKDLTGIVVQPVQFPLSGKTFVVPDATSTSVVLNLVSPTATRDYPMGRFESEDGAVRGSLVALDDFTTNIENNLRAVPIAVNMGGSGEFLYLAILEGEEMKHVDSLPLGDRIKVRKLERSGNLVTVHYLVHDRNQALAELPTVETSAVIDIAERKIVQAGRNPSTEAYVENKSFVGEYVWQETVAKDGGKVTPSKPDVFTLIFDANQVSLGTDCNTGGTTYTAETGSSTKFMIGELATTKKFCEAGQETEYFEMFKKVTNYTESQNGTLILQLSDESEMKFKPKKQEIEMVEGQS